MATKRIKPYYSNHKVVELTCPHCKSRLFHIGNAAFWAEYNCTCGQWKRYCHHSILPASEGNKDWEYQPNQDGGGNGKD